jgi:hypothetical protein
MTFGVLDVLDAATVPQKLSQRCFAVHIGLAAKIFSIQYQKIERACRNVAVINPTI